MAPGLVRLALLSLLFSHTTYAIDCYGFNDRTYVNNVKCPGSDACCGNTATCLPNRLCRNAGTTDGVLVRGPCAIFPYDPIRCSPLCVYNETESRTGRFPRVSTCDDGSYCCDNDSACCENGDGIFLDTRGLIIENPDESEESTSSTTKSSSSSTSSTSTKVSSSTSTTESSATTEPSSTRPGGSSTTITSSISPSPTNKDNEDSASESSGSSSGLSTGAKAGLGAGIPLGVAAIIGIVVLIWLQQRRINLLRAQGNGQNPTHELDSHEFVSQNWGTQHYEPPKEVDGNNSSKLAELPSWR